jgi:hypothetical protein
MTIEAQQVIATSQRGHWDYADDAARKRLVAASDALAARIGRPPFDAESRRPRTRTLDLEHIGELEMLATVAEATVRLAEEIDALRLEIAAVRGDRS